MPNFCRHNRLIQNCPICSREQDVELRPVLTTSAPRSGAVDTPEGRSSRVSSPQSRTSATRPARRATESGPRAGTGVRVRRLVRSADDGYRCSLVPGVKSSEDAARLAGEIAFSAARLQLVAAEPPGPLAEVADPDGDIEERTWLAFLISYLGPLSSPPHEDPFVGVTQVRRPWASADTVAPELAEAGPRGALDPARGGQTIEAYRAWVARAGSQAAAFAGEAAWTPQRRFERLFERLALPGLHRDARFELLLMLGTVGVYPLEPGSLQLGGDNEVTVAAKRAFGIGDSLLLDRRAAVLAEEAGVAVGALDLALYNWGRGSRFTGGIAEPAAARLAERAAELEGPRGALGL